MSLITQCPECATMFKVVPDQLRISGGWVRCGQCDKVFDANAHLHTEPGSDSKEIRSDKPSGTLQNGQTRPAATNQVRNVKATADPMGTDADRNLVERPAAGQSSLTIAVETLESSTQEEHVHGTPLDQGDVVDELVRAVAASSASPSGESETPQFLNSNHTGKVRGGKLAQFFWATVCFLMLTVLAVQVLVQERDRIVATVPITASVLQPLCDFVGCKITPLRQIESIVIDHSSFTVGPGGVYVLSFAIKSAALTEVAIPSLELTLTDFQDRVVARRVFSAKELGYPGQMLAPGGEWTGLAPVEVKLPEAGARISGYRLLAFYP